MDERLLRDYLRHSLKRYTYISFPVPPEVEGEPEADAVMQISAIEPAEITIKTFWDRCIDNPDLFPIVAQPLAAWGIPAGGVCDEMNVYEFEDVLTLDVLALVGTGNPAVRKRMHVWQTGHADVDGCLRLHSPLVRRPGVDNLMSPAILVLFARCIGP